MSVDANGCSIRGDWNVESLRCGYWPKWLPPQRQVTLDSYSAIRTAYVALENSTTADACHWSDDHLVVEKVAPLHRIPLGAGWRASGSEWAGTAQSREPVGGEFLEVNVTHLVGDETVKIRLPATSPLARLFCVFGCPEAMFMLEEFSSPIVEIRIGEQTVSAFRVTKEMQGWQTREIPLDGCHEPKDSLDVFVRGQGKRYGLVCWRLIGVS